MAAGARPQVTRREIALSVAVALWGVAIAIALIPLFSQPAPAGQLPSHPTSIGLHASAPIRFVLALILVPIVLTIALRPAMTRLAPFFGWACLVSLWAAAVGATLPWVLLPCAAVLVAALALRNRDLHFTRRDVILLPVYGVTFLALTDAFPNLSVDRVVIVAALLVLALRIAVSFIPGTLEPAFAFLLAPAALALQTSFFARDQRYFGWHAVAIVVLTPFIVRPLLTNRRRAMMALTFVVYPIAVYSYTNAVGLMTAEGRPRVIFFEDAHHLLPASEMLRGERLYRDVVPVHGLIEDGILSYALIRIQGDDSIGSVLRGRGVLALNTVAIYALAGAATGSVEVGVLAAFLAAITGITNGSMRVLPSLVTLAILAHAVRRRKRRWFAYAGAGAVISAMASLDFGLFTILTVGIMGLRRPRRSAPLRAAAPQVMIGALAAGIPLLIILAAYGVAGDFFRTNLFELPAGAQANRLDVFTPPAGFKAFRAVPEIAIAFFDKTSTLYIAWMAALLIVAVALSRPPRRRFEPIVVIALWVVVAALAYAQRHHLFFEFAVPPLAAAAGWHLVRRRSPFAAIYVFVIVAAAQLTTHIAITSWVRHARGPIEPQWMEIADLPRARGALFTTRDAAVIESAKHYVESTLGPQETFFDFSDRGILYFLLNRDCPIRYPVVPFYESVALQREVIARLEANRNVRAALIPTGPGVDNIPSRERAPLVWQYLQQHFKPDFSAGEVTFWRRVESDR